MSCRAGRRECTGNSEQNNSAFAKQFTNVFGFGAVRAGDSENTLGQSIASLHSFHQPLSALFMASINVLLSTGLVM